jgi:hypothetical protein
MDDPVIVVIVEMRDVTIVAIVVTIALTIKDEVVAVDLPEGDVVVAEDVAAQPHGWTLLVRYAAKKAIMPKIAGQDTHTKRTMVTRKYMPHTAWIQTGTRTPVPHITLPASSTI